MQTTSNWYALYTRPRWEKKVVTLLTKQGIETYCPFSRVTKQWSDRKKVVEEPLFKSYVFIRIPEADQWVAKSIDGVINIVHWLGKAAVIPDEEIEIIKRFLYDYTNVKLEKTEVTVDDKVRILNGPMMMMEGNVVEIKYKTVKVILPSLGYAMVAEVEKSNLEIINLLHGKSDKISKSDSLSLNGEIRSQQTGLREEDAIN
ncbi:MAG TPA: UpxY family transcription antiterminator [Flavitalea sp.]|nr:UpxY family transcription antiterminator [Flavitalea sp.]